MQQIYKMLFFNHHFIFFLNKNILLVINSLFLIICLSSCHVFLPHKNELISIKNRIYFNNTTNKKHVHQVSTGEKIAPLLMNSGVCKDDILRLIQKDSALNNLKSGQYLLWTVDKSGILLELKWKIANFQTKIYKRGANLFYNEKFLDKNTLFKKVILIKKNSNFFNSALKLGMNKFDINNVIKAVNWKINFNKLNIGSSFNLVFSHDILNKKNILLGVKFNNFKKKYYFVYAFNNNFYDTHSCIEKDKSINTSFIKKYRISSEFNLHRLHPVTHRIAPHLGVDLAMPQGTPILATSNGKVVQANFDKIAGFYITLKNNYQYVTRYMHLKKIFVKLGEKVKIGQKIALSGNTGRTTGPHLHYEIWIKNHPINPMNLKCIPCYQLIKKEKEIYLKQLKKILKYLE